jgi:hypothetical protein
MSEEAATPDAVSEAKSRVDQWATRRLQEHLDQIAALGIHRTLDQLNPIHRYTSADEIELASYVPRLDDMVWFNHGPVVDFVKRRAEDLKR